MADKKISALTAATTPLAGTEVLPIVQSGNTVKVSIANVTAGRGISATSVTNGLGAESTPAYTFTGDANTGMWSPAADAVAFSTAGLERLRVTSAGNVGIGTSTPGFKLAVSGSIGISSDVNGKFDIGRFSAGFGGGAIDFTGGTFGVIQVGSSEKVRITTGGAVGIGEISPDYKLDVNGAIGFAPGASVTPVDNGDVVFELTNDTTLTVKAKGSDGVVRSATLTLS